MPDIKKNKFTGNILFICLIILLFNVRLAAFGYNEFLVNLNKEIVNDNLKSLKQRIKESSTYIINFDFHPEKKLIKGEQTLFFKNNTAKPIDKVYLFLYPNLIGKSNIKINEVKVIGFKSLYNVNRNFILEIELLRNIIPSEPVQVQISFKVEPAKYRNFDASLTTQFFSQIGILLDNKRVKDFGLVSASENCITMGFSYPILIPLRYTEDTTLIEEIGGGTGDFDIFDFSNYKVIIKYPELWESTASGSKVSSNKKDNKNTDIYCGSFIRNFVFVLMKDYIVREKELNNPLKMGNKIGISESKSNYFNLNAKNMNFAADSSVNKKIYIYYDKNNSKFAEKLEKTVEGSIEYYTKIYGPLCFNEVKVVETPLINGAGGAEFPGMILLAKMLYTPDGLSKNLTDDFFMGIQNRKLWDGTVDFVVAHEVAHQWWNAAVGSNSIQFPFLDEALANYSALKFIEHKYYKSFADLIRYLNVELPYKFYISFIGKDKPLNSPSYKYKSLFEYMSIVYGKGAMFYFFIENKTGEKTLLSDLKKYYQDNIFKIAGFNEFAKNIIADKPDIEEEINKWLYSDSPVMDSGKLDLQELLNYSTLIESLNK